MKTENLDRLDGKFNIFYLLRVAQGIKVKDLARELSVTSAYINAIENGERFPSNRLLRDYAQALDVSMETILEFNPAEQSGKKFKNVLLSILRTICDVED